jgi:hypothetical protein
MQCLGCRADNQMRLMDVVRDDTIKVPVIEHHTYMCSACRHIARRLVFRRAKTPITHLPVITTPIDELWKGRVAAPRAWGNAVEKLRSRQTDLKQRGAAEKITASTKAVEKVRSKQAALAETSSRRKPAAGTLNRLSRCSKSGCRRTTRSGAARRLWLHGCRRHRDCRNRAWSVWSGPRSRPGRP